MFFSRQPDEKGLKINMFIEYQHARMKQQVYITRDPLTALKRHLILKREEIWVLHLEHWERYPISAEQKIHLDSNLEYVRILSAQTERTIVPPQVPEDTLVCKPAHIDMVMELMKTQGLSFTEESADYYEGIGRYFSYNNEKNIFSFKR